MKTISLWQSWASLIVLGAKRFETRSWETLYRGPPLIHAAKKRDRYSLGLIGQSPFREALSPLFNDSFSSLAQCLPFGCILGVADLVECWRTFDGVMIGGKNHTLHLPEGNEREFGDFSTGRYAWQLENVRRFTTPIRYRGAQGLFEVPDHVVAEQMQIARAA